MLPIKDVTLVCVDLLLELVGPVDRHEVGVFQVVLRAADRNGLRLARLVVRTVHSLEPSVQVLQTLRRVDRVAQNDVRVVLRRANQVLRRHVPSQVNEVEVDVCAAALQSCLSVVDEARALHDLVVLVLLRDQAIDQS